MKSKISAVIAVLFCVLLIGANVFVIRSCVISTQQNAEPTAVPTPAGNQVLGHGTGVMPGRVVWSYEPDAVRWNGSGYWWTPSNFNETVIRSMLDDSVCALANKSDVNEAWEALFNYKSGHGYKAGEKIAIKANMNGCGDLSGATNAGFTCPMVMRVLLRSLVAFGVAPSDITLFDATRVFPTAVQELCTEGELAGVRFAYYDPDGPNDCIADKNEPYVWSLKFEGETTYLPTCVTEATYLIDLASLKGHTLTGVTLSAKNHFGTMINSNRLNAPQAANIHKFVAANDFSAGTGWVWSQRPASTYTVLTDIAVNSQLGGKTVLFMLDGMVCAPNQTAQVTYDGSRWSSEPFNGGWTASLFISQDSIALDSVGIDFLINEPSVPASGVKLTNSTFDNYIIEAASIPNPPSGTVYYDGHGNVATCPGVHEHWNNAHDKQYSRNLGAEEGIELIKLGKAK